MTHRYHRRLYERHLLLQPKPRYPDIVRGALLWPALGLAALLVLAWLA